MTNDKLDTATHRREVVRMIRRDIDTGSLGRKYDGRKFSQIALHCLDMGHSLAWAVSDAFNQSRKVERPPEVLGWNNCVNGQFPRDTYEALYLTGCDADEGGGVTIDSDDPDFYAIYGVNPCGELEALHDFSRDLGLNTCRDLARIAAQDLELALDVHMVLGESLA